MPGGHEGFYEDHRAPLPEIDEMIEEMIQEKARRSAIVRISGGWEEFMQTVRERSYLRHVLAHHIEINGYERVRNLRAKHGM